MYLGAVLILNKLVLYKHISRLIASQRYKSIVFIDFY